MLWYTSGRYAIGDVAAAAADDDHDDDVVVVDSGVHVHYLNQVKCVITAAPDCGSDLRD